MKIAVVGSREFSDIKFAKYKIMQTLLFAIPDVDENKEEPILISGGARGIDSLAEKVANQYKVKTKIFSPDWNKYGKRAGAIRNQLIVDRADKIIAFWDGKSKGTKITIDMAIKAGKPVDIYIRN